MTYSNNIENTASNFNILLRKLLNHKLTSINRYTSHINEIGISDLRDLLYQILKNEKIHYLKLLDMLKKVDISFQEKASLIPNLINIKNKPLRQHYSNDHKDTSINVLNKIRINLIEEFNLLDLYDSILEKNNTEEFLTLIHDFTSDAKLHIEMLNYSLFILDKDLYEFINNN